MVSPYDLVVRGGTVYDGSLKAQLARLRREMAEGGV